MSWATHLLLRSGTLARGTRSWSSVVGGSTGVGCSTPPDSSCGSAARASSPLAVTGVGESSASILTNALAHSRKQAAPSSQATFNVRPLSVDSAHGRASGLSGLSTATDLDLRNMNRDLAVTGTSRRRRRRRTPTASSPAATATLAGTRGSVAAARRAWADEPFAERPMPHISDELALRIAIILGVSPLNRPLTCHGYVNECSCGECCARAQSLGRRGAEVRQPWHA